MMAEHTNKEEQLKNRTININSERQMPKNLRQIGKISNGIKIYVEDYVKTYIRQLAESEAEGITAAVLVGEYIKNEQDRLVFIFGAIHIENIWNDDEIKFSEETWTSIYEAIKHYFPDGEIAGWYLRKNEWTERNYELIKTVHLDNFAGRDKVLLQYDILEKDGEFYCCENDELVLQSGYFIYYDKNEEMQDYMIDNKQTKREEQFVEDRAVREFRNIYEEKHPTEKKDQRKTTIKMMYAAGMVIVMVVMAIGITAIRNQEKVKGLEEALQTISNSLSNDNNITLSPTKAAGNIFENANKDNNKVTPYNDDDITQAPDISEEPSITEEPIITNEPTITNSPSPTEKVEPIDVPLPTKAPDPTKAEQEPLKPVITADQLKLYVVESGDTLAGICYKLYGNVNQMKLIQDLNQIVDENKIYIGQELLIPKK